jgi:hypothetical protein
MLLHNPTAKEIPMGISLILEKVSFLKGVIDPNWVDGNPGQPGPIYRAAIADYMVAELVRNISQNVSSQELGARLLAAGRELAAQAAVGMMSSFDEGDDICPPWYWNRPIPHGGGGPVFSLQPEPSPWLQHLTPAMSDVVLAVALRHLASVTTNTKASGAIKELGESVMKGASGRLYDEYCGTPVKPRMPTPKPVSAAA